MQSPLGSDPVSVLLGGSSSTVASGLVVVGEKKMRDLLIPMICTLPTEGENSHKCDIFLSPHRLQAFASHRRRAVQHQPPGADHNARHAFRPMQRAHDASVAPVPSHCRLPADGRVSRKEKE